MRSPNGGGGRHVGNVNGSTPGDWERGTAFFSTCLWNWNWRFYYIHSFLPSFLLKSQLNWWCNQIQQRGTELNWTELCCVVLCCRNNSTSHHCTALHSLLYVSFLNSHCPHCRALRPPLQVVTLPYCSCLMGFYGPRPLFNKKHRAIASCTPHPHELLLTPTLGFFVA